MNDLSFSSNNNGMNHIKTALRKEPIVSLDDGATIGYEVLTDIVPLGNVTGLAAWRRIYSNMERALLEDIPVTSAGFISVNVDTWQLFDKEIMSSIRGMFASARLRGVEFVLEWTETPFASPQAPSGALEAAAGILAGIRSEFDVKLCVDDAGSGEDAMGRISMLHPDVVKIDGTLFQRACLDRRALSVVHSLVEITKYLGALSVIEWIETKEMFAIARDCGAHAGQGFLWMDTVNAPEIHG